jgi:hypothetical protein
VTTTRRVIDVDGPSPAFVKPGHIQESRESARRGKRRRRRPCGNPPAAPANVVMTFTATEALTHLRFTGRVKWDEVTTDEGGHPARPTKYETQIRATNAAGVPQELEDSRVKLRYFRKSPAKHRNLKAATNPSGSTFRFDTHKAHGLSVGDNVRIADCKNPATYNGTYSVTAVPNGTRFEVNGGSSGVADCLDPGRMVDDDDRLHIVTRDLPRPKTWYWQARVRAVDSDGCEGDWSAWTAQQLPSSAANPKPPVPSGLQLDFDKHGKARHARWRGKLQWNEVRNFDYAGTPAEDEQDLSRYQWQVEVSNDGVVGDDHRFGGTKEANDDDDAGTLVRAGFPIRNPKNWFRARVRSIDRFNRRGNWSDWTSWQRPGNEAPPAPTEVTIYENAADRVVIDWTALEDPDDGDLIHVDIDYFQVQITKLPSFGTVYKWDKHVDGTRRAFKTAKADAGDIFYGRGRSVNSDGEKSAWIPATIAGNSNPAAAPEGVRIGKAGQIAKSCTVPGTVVAKHYDPSWTAGQTYDIVGIRARAGRHDAATHPNDGCPTSGDLVANLFVEDAGSSTSQKILASDSRLRINQNTHKDTAWIRKGDSNFLVTQIQEDESVSLKVGQAGSAKNLVVELILEPA